jgi:hypothetical protein
MLENMLSELVQAGDGHAKLREYMSSTHRKALGGEPEADEVLLKQCCFASPLNLHVCSHTTGLLHLWTP